ncbi:hypothetical protein EDB89DRAFT_2234569, partial [Lactarius sanguifluus]
KPKLPTILLSVHWFQILCCWAFAKVQGHSGSPSPPLNDVSPNCRYKCGWIFFSHSRRTKDGPSHEVPVTVKNGRYKQVKFT